MNIEDVKSKYEKQLLQISNVTGVGIGEKGRKKVIKVFVACKVPESALQPENIIPKILEGWEIDVEEIGIVKVQE